MPPAYGVHRTEPNPDGKSRPTTKTYVEKARTQ